MRSPSRADCSPVTGAPDCGSLEMIPPTSFALHGYSARIPSRGLGTFQVDPKQYPEGSVKDSVLKALEIGYRHLDAALAYGWGSVEVSIGQAIKESRIPREELFIVTKLYAFTYIQAKMKLQPDGVLLILLLHQAQLFSQARGC